MPADAIPTAEDGSRAAPAAADRALACFGPPGTWPPGLALAVQVALGTTQPAWVAWGPARRTLANDACLPWAANAAAPDLAALWPGAWPALRPA
ncbi:hypothetical protein, partial [Paracraurococcus ruber]|nr:hypothetical protein [Paracraurococcus ruber]